MKATIHIGDSLELLKGLPSQSVQTCVTSPPYWGLRDYGEDGQLGLEETPEQFVENLVVLFREVKRVLKDDGTLWLNLGDSYAGSWGNSGSRPELDESGGGQRNKEADYIARGGWDERRERPPSSYPHELLKPKDLVGIPWRTAFALQADGWYLRSDIIWSKPNPMPESVTDRPTKAHEYIFLLSKSRKYYYDHDAIKETSITQDERRPYAPGQIDNRGNGHDRGGGQKRKTDKQRGHSRRHAGFNDRWDSMTKEEQGALGRNKRTVWTVATRPYSGAHFATYPPQLIQPCIEAGSKKGDLVLDPFSGSGTTGMVALGLGRNYVGLELNPEYAELSRKRIEGDAPMFNTVEITEPVHA